MELVTIQHHLHEMPGVALIVRPCAGAFGDIQSAGIKHLVLDVARGKLGTDGIPGQL
jgi:hypothetical protein